MNHFEVFDDVLQVRLEFDHHLSVCAVVSQVEVRLAFYRLINKIGCFQIFDIGFFEYF